MPNDGSWLALALWAAGIGAVAWFWEQIEQRLLEWQWRRRVARNERAWREWYAARPCKASATEPWRGPEERKTSKLGRF